MALFNRADGVADLTMLSSPSDSSIVKNLSSRLNRKLIYTNIGDVLVACNPFERLPIYGQGHIDMYSKGSLSDTEPHIYALAETAYRRLLSEQENQAVIISGESGAGKTECAKLILSYVSSVSGSAGSAEQVKQIIADSNPIMESFGNAKTVRNDNSSRFGKYLQVQFTTEGDPCGGTVTNFLLEKTRVARQAAGERNFHIFYQLLAGATPEQKTEFALYDSPSDYHYLSQSGETTAPGINDVEWHAEVCNAFNTIGLDADEQWYIWQLLSGCLMLGNIQFSDNEDPPCSVSTPDELANAAYLLGLEPSILEMAIVNRNIQTGSRAASVYMVPQTAEQAANIRDALAKEVFSRLFDFLVKRINDAMSARGSKIVVGILDIYGFEIFEVNSFEQFCINYVNEKLQQIFIDLTVKSEQQEYHDEGLKWKDIKFSDNLGVVQALESKNPVGVFRTLDDVCRTVHAVDATTADQKFMSTLAKNCGSNENLMIGDPESGNFTVRHYAGDVQYTAYGFTGKNNDNLYTSLIAAVQTSTLPFLTQMWKEDMSNNKSAPTTSGAKIRSSAADLVSSLRSCTPHYIRCIKSNDKRQPLTMTTGRVTHQCKYLGLLENVKVRRSGFAYRNPFHIFANRYKELLPEEEKGRASSGDQASCEYICDYVCKKIPDIAKKEFTMGVTKIFVSNPETIYHMEDFMEKVLDPEGYAEKEKEFKVAQKAAKKSQGSIGEKKKCFIQ